MPHSFVGRPHFVVPKVTKIEECIFEGVTHCAHAFAVIVWKPIGINVDETSITTADR